MKTLTLITLFLALAANNSCGGQGLIPDSSPLAISAGDFTALIKIEGCGFQPQVQEGYTYCRVTEGPVGSMAVTFIAPPQSAQCQPHACAPNNPSCDPASCVDFTLFYPNQAPAYSDTIPHGQTSKSVPWTKLVQKNTFDPDDTGFWLYTYTIRWTDNQGREQKTISDGEIRLRVVRSQVCPPDHGPNDKACQAYVPLRNSPDDPNFVWSWVEDGQTIRMTTAARTYVSF